MATTTPVIGAWRDRTNLYISYRQSYTHHPAKRTRLAGPSSRYTDNDGDSERAGLMSNVESDGDAVIEMDFLPPRWLDMQDEINTCLGEITSKTKKLEQLHAKHVLPGFDDESVKAREEREIEQLTQEITRGFTTCQNRIRKIDIMLREQQQQQGGKLSSADEKMAQNLKISLATKVGEVSTLFRKKQSAYLRKLKSLGGMGTPSDRVGSPSVQSPYTDPALMDSEADRSSAQSTLLQSAQVRKRTGINDTAIEQREREIEKIAQGVIDLSNIFQELNSMVIDQGTLLDRIDYNVERTADHVKEADKELKVATGYQERGVKRKVILLLIILIVGAIILLLVNIGRRGGSSAPTAPAPIAAPAPALPPRHPSPLTHDIAQRQRQWKQRRRRHIV